MRNITQGIAIILSVALCAATTAYAAGNSPEHIKARIGKGDPVAGKVKSAMCQGCHGEKGMSDSPSFPRLSGQYAGYLKKQIIDFQKNLRNDPMMSGMAATITEKQDLLDITAYFASQDIMKGSGSGNALGKRVYIEGNDTGAYGCINCHGGEGKGKSANNYMFPIIGGQHRDYLIKQLTDLKKHERDNDPSGMMGDIASKLSAAEIEAVSEYLAAQ
jgi:cytochrome c553